MKTCPFCQKANVREHKFCEKCGKPLDPTPASPAPDAAGAESTVRWTGQALAAIRDQARRDSVGLTCAALAVQMLVLLVATAWFLRRKDAR